MTGPFRDNLINNLPGSLPSELVEVIADSPHVRIERIVSTGQVSPGGFWYDQAEHEWVLVLTGEAKLRIEHDPQPIDLKPGDHIHIPAHQRHRVEWTSPETPTVWLAVFYH